MSDKYDPPEPLEMLHDAVEGYCDLETGECVTSPPGLLDIPRPSEQTGTGVPDRRA